MGAAICGPVRLDAVSVTAYNVLSRANISYQPACTGVSVVRDEEATGSNPATPTSSDGIRLSPDRRIAVLSTLHPGSPSEDDPVHAVLAIRDHRTDLLAWPVLRAGYFLAG